MRTIKARASSARRRGEGGSGGNSGGTLGGGSIGSNGLFDLTLHRVEQALHERTRYRYVQPRVLSDGLGIRIESPCCSRNVDAQGGLIDIAKLMRDASGIWHLSARDHRQKKWLEQAQSADLGELLDLVCLDRERVFWP